MKTELFDYDDRDAESIFDYAKQLENMTFRQIKEEYDQNPYKSYVNMHDFSTSGELHEDPLNYGGSLNYNARGQLGNLIEKMFFGYSPNGNQEADFPKAGLELKTTPIDYLSDGSYRAGERLSITNISYDEPVEENFKNSHVWEKIQLILLIHYLREKSIDRLDYEIKFVNLFTPLDYEEDMAIILDDYNIIINKIKAGKAHELSESDTKYLGACTKGANAEASMRPQYYGNHKLAKKRNFCFKISYMNYILQTKILKNESPYESILKGSEQTNFEEYVLGLINSNVGKTDKELCKRYGRDYDNNKAQWNDLTFRMLGITRNHAEEFEKANIVVKTIRVEQNGANKESMSFPPFLFKELVKEKWESSTIFNYFDTTRFLFVVFKNNGESYTLLGAKMWNMPYKDLNKTIKKEWERIKKVIANGVKFTLTKQKTGTIIVKNNLPGISDNEILHVRPHSNKSAYLLNNGFRRGDIEKDANELPDGQWMTTQSFWLNSSYVKKQIEDIINKKCRR